MKLAFKVQRQWQQLQFAAVKLPPRETSSKEYQIKGKKSQASCFLALLLLLLSAVEEENELKLAHKWFREPSPWEIINKSVFTGWVVVVAVVVICIYHYWTFQCGVCVCVDVGVWYGVCSVPTPPLAIFGSFNFIFKYCTHFYMWVCCCHHIYQEPGQTARWMDGRTDSQTCIHRYIHTHTQSNKLKISTTI